MAMLIKVIIVEDEILHAWGIEQMFEELGGYCLANTFQDATTAFTYIEKEYNNIDIALIDIQLKGLENGIDLARKIIHLNIPVIFITQDENEKNYLNVKDIPRNSFLTKPFSKYTLDSVIRLLLSTVPKTTLIEPASDSLIFVKVGNKKEVIQPASIFWIEANRNYCTIHIADKHYILKCSLKSLYGKLPKDIFIHIHKSFVVKLSLIKRIDLKAKRVWIGDMPLPLGRRYVKDLQQHLIYLG
jgi:DNA-binding LytR/AlgR family response regulator